MDSLLPLALPLAALLLLLLTLLFGQNPLFARTPLPRLHRLLTGGLPQAARRLGGRRAAALLHAAAELCCERSNPAVQTLFLVLLLGGYAAYAAYLFPMLPLLGVPAWHKYTGSAAVLFVLALFAAASCSDPGAIATPAAAAAHAALYPHDALWYPDHSRQCGSCGIPRPARSRHCRACGRCVGRMDHHCIWVNNCVGLLNMRWFLAFLAATMALCFYAAAVGVATLRADMAAHDIGSVALEHPQTGELVYLSDSRRLTLRYMLAAYAPQASVTFFAGATGAIVAGFLGFQLWLVCRGKQGAQRSEGLTTIEFQRYRSMAQALEEAERQLQEARSIEERADAALRGSGGQSQPAANGLGAAAAGAPSGGVDATGPAQQQPFRSAAEQRQERQQQERQRRRQQLRELRPYDRGLARNLAEVLFPHRFLRQAAAAGTAAASRSAAVAGGGAVKKGA